MTQNLNTAAAGMKSRLRTVGTVAGVALVSLLLVAAPAHAEAKEAPKEFCDGLDTATAWTSGVAAALAVIGLIMIGISLFFQHRNGGMDDGPWKKLGYWLGGAVLIAGATSLAGVFIGNQLNCAG